MRAQQGAPTPCSTHKRRGEGGQIEERVWLESEVRQHDGQPRNAGRQHPALHCAAALTSFHSLDLPTLECF